MIQKDNLPRRFALTTQTSYLRMVLPSAVSTIY
jgi:hypothetical protein